MKIAYCLTGLIDCEKHTVSGLDEIGEHVEIDYFCHTWDNEKNPGKDLINTYPFISTSMSTYEEFEEYVLSLPNTDTLYKKAKSSKNINHFIRTGRRNPRSRIQRDDGVLQGRSKNR